MTIERADSAVQALVRACPICHTTETRELLGQRYALFDDSDLPSDTTIVACETCGMVYAASCAQSAVYRRHYARHSKYDTAAQASGSGETADDAYRLDALVRRLLPMVGTTASILDVGAGRGGLLAAFRRYGCRNVAGIDPSAGCVAAMVAAKLPAWMGELEQDTWPTDPRRYDVVVLSHVLEHVFDVADAFERSALRVASGGAIYVEVPDAARYTTDGFPPFYFFDPEHINHFDEPALESLAARHGWTVCAAWSLLLDLEGGRRYPAIGVLMRRTTVAAEGPLSTAADAVRRYVDRSTAIVATPVDRSGIDALAKSRTSLVVWGAGSHAQRLLAQTALGDCAIDCIIDADPGKQGRRLAGRLVVAPDDGLARAASCGASVVVAIAVGADAVVERVRRSLPATSVIRL